MALTCLALAPCLFNPFPLPPILLPIALQARKGEADHAPDDIMAMVKAQCAPPHRLILFLQQSSVEWCSSLWTHVVQEVDPHYQRTVMVCSKFDNRQASSQQEGKVDGHGLAGWVQGSQLGRCQPLVFLTQRTTLINAYLPRP